MSEEEAMELREEFELECGEEGRFMAMPTSVRCHHCFTRFTTKHFEDEGEQEWS
jgi:hypothetical protein